MTLGQEIGGLLAQTLTAPRSAAERLLAMRLPAQAVWLGLALVSVLAFLLMRLTVLAVAADGGTGAAPSGLLWTNPFAGVATQAALITVTALAVAASGRPGGGKGRFDQALLLVVWLEFVLALVAALQVVALALVPPAGALLSLLSLPLFLWLLVQFTAALHRADNLLGVLAGLVLAFLALAFGLSALFLILGLDPTILSPV